MLDDVVFVFVVVYCGVDDLFVFFSRLEVDGCGYEYDDS